MISAKPVAYSLAPTGARLLTVEVTMPKFILAQFNTHRVFSRNAASSRAIPTAKLIEKVRTRPVMPVEWGQNQRGMVAEEVVSPEVAAQAAGLWAQAANDAADTAQRLMDLGIHKQIANRVLEPFLYTTVIVSATEWGNFFHLRCADDAQPEIAEVARQICEIWYGVDPKTITENGLHVPYVEMEDIMALRDLGYGDASKEGMGFWAAMVSAGRCARVSYLTHDGRRSVQDDIELAQRLQSNGHWSPFEHQATPMAQYEAGVWSGNFQGWRQFRQQFADNDRRTYKRRAEDYLRKSP